MLFDAWLGRPISSAGEIVARAQAAEAAGYDAVWSEESSRDAFVPLALAALSTQRVQLGTGIAVAFARNPMTLAQLANDLQLYSGGRFILGLGTQVRAHIERRFSMPWSKPASRMREMVSAIRAIWASWQEGSKLDFRGDFYAHTLMPPLFNPGPNPYGMPPIFVAAVGPLMTRTAAEIADGVLLHGFTTDRYVREIALRELENGFAQTGRSRRTFQVCGAVLVVTGHDELQKAEARRAAAETVAFYASTPTYRPVLELHGWGDLQTELHSLAQQGRWDEMGSLVDDEVLAAFAVIAEPKDVAEKLMARCAGVYDRVSFNAPWIDEKILLDVREQLKALLQR